MSEETRKVCPIAAFGGNMHTSAYCIGKDCAWWCEFADSCAVPLMTEILADSTICQTIFERRDDNAD